MRRAEIRTSCKYAQPLNNATYRR